MVVLSSALLNIQCLKDFAGPPDPPEYLVEALSQEIDTVHVGDKISPPEAKLLVDGSQATTAWEATVIEGTDVMSVDSADNQIHLIVLKRGTAKVRVRATNSAISDTTLHSDFTFVAVVPRIRPAGPDTLFSVGDTIQLTATATTFADDPITEDVPAPAWTVVGLDTAATLLSGGRVLAVKNGDITLMAQIDTATATRIVRVRQRVITITMTQPGLFLAGGTSSLSATAADLRGNAIPSPAFAWASLNPNIATVNATTGAITAVASGQATISAAAEGVSAFALVTVAISGAPPVNLWAPMTSGTTQHLNAVWGFSPTSIFATGREAESPVLQSNGSTWTPVGPGQLLHGLWGTTPSSIYAVGLGGKILRYNGTAWVAMTSNTNQALFAVWGASESDIFAVGAGGTIVRYDGTNWAPIASGVTEDLLGIWGRSRSDIYAVGANGTILHYNGSAWNPEASGTAQELRAVWGTSATNVYAVGVGGTIRRFDGANWLAIPAPSGFTGALNGVWGTSSGDVYVAAQSGMLAFDGTEWSVVEIGAAEHFNAAWGGGTSATDVIMVGNGGSVYRGVRGAAVAVTPAAPLLEAIGATHALTATAMDAANNAITGVNFAWFSTNTPVATVSTSGVVSAVSNGTASICATAPGGAISCTDVTVNTAASVAQVLVTVPESGNPLTLTATAKDANGNTVGGVTTTWSSLNPSIATIDASSGVVTPVASGQVTMRAQVGLVQGFGLVTVIVPVAAPVNLWAEQSSGVSTALTGVWGSDASNVYAVGVGGVILRFNGESWSPQASNTPEDLRAVWGLSATSLFAAGLNGTIRRYNGTSWDPVTAPFSVHFGIWGAAPNQVFIGGNARILSNSSGAFQIIHNFSGDVRSMWGSSATNVYAGLAVAGTPALLRFDGAGWDASPSGNIPTGMSVFGVWGTSASDVWVVGSGSNVVRTNGTSFTPSTTASGQTLFGVWGSSSNDVYVVGSAGTIERFNGTAWTLMTASSGTTFNAIWGYGTTVFVVGDGGSILRGYRSATLAVPAIPSLAAIGATHQATVTARDAGNLPISGTIGYTWSSSDENVATVNASGLVTAVANGTASICANAHGGAQGCTNVTVDQVATSITLSPDGVTIASGTTTFSATARDANNNAISGQTFTWSSLNTAVATINSSGLATAASSGQSTVSASADGVTGYALLTVALTGATEVNLWAPATSGTTTQFNGAWGLNASNIYAVGDDANMRQFNGSSWNEVTLPISRTLNAIWGTSASDIFAVGNIGTVIRFNGTNWATMTNPASAGVSGVWGASPRDVFAVGAVGLIMRYDGTSWSAMTSNTSESLRDVYGFSATDVFAVGNAGTVLRYNGTSWTSAATDLPAVESLARIWGTSGSDLFGVSSSSGRIYHYDGGSWSEQSASGSGVPLGVWGSASSDVYSVGVLGRVNRYNGSNWTLHSQATTSQLQGVWGTSAGDVWAVGFDGTILRGYRGATVVVSPTSPTLTVLDDSLTVSATARDASNTTVNGVTFTWASDNTPVAEVNPTSGLVTARGNGSANICATATSGTASGCTTVTVTGFSADEIEALVEEASRQWLLASTAVMTAGVTATQARTYSSSFTNGQLNFYSSIDNGSSSAEQWNRNTRGWQNNSTSAQRHNVSALWNGGTNLNDLPFTGYYGALKAAVDVLKIIRVKGITVRNASDTRRAETIAVLMQGAALSGIALNYDKGFAPNENTEAYDPITFAPLIYVNRRNLRDSALVKLDEAVALANANSFTTLPNWTNGNSHTSAQIVQIARTLAALTHVNYARDEAEAAVVDWTTVAALASAGLSGANSLTYVGDGTAWYSESLAWFNRIDAGRVSTRIARLLHPATQTDPWPASGNAQPNSADTRLGDGSFGNAANAAALGTVVATASKGSQFAWTSTGALFPPANGDYHQSNIAHIRYDVSGTQAAGGIVDGIGPMPVLNVTMNNLILAEAHLRTGNPASAAALINVSRAAAGLPAVSGLTPPGSPSDGPCTSIGMLSQNLAASCTLWAYLIYEKEIELLGLGMQSFFEERRLPVVTVTGMFVQGLIPGTPREMPVPWFVLQGRGEGLYSWGGTNAANSTPP